MKIRTAVEDLLLREMVEDDMFDLYIEANEDIIDELVPENEEAPMFESAFEDDVDDIGADIDDTITDIYDDDFIL